MKLTKEKRDHLILVGLGTAIVIAGVWVGVVSGQKQKIKSLSADISDVEAKIQKAKTWVNNYDALLAEVEDLKEKVRAEEDKLVSATDTYRSTTEAVTKVMVRHRVDKKAHAPPVESQVELLADFPYRQTSFMLQGEGYYHDFGRFLADFENSYPHMRIQKLRLTPGTSSPTPIPEKLTFEMEVVMLVNKPAS